MARKRHSDEDVFKLQREIELKLTGGIDVASACYSVGISDATYCNWRKRFGGLNLPDDASGSWPPLYWGLEEFIDDLRENMRLENNVLFPLFEPGTRTVRDRSGGRLDKGALQ